MLSREQQPCAARSDKFRRIDFGVRDRQRGTAMLVTVFALSVVGLLGTAILGLTTAAAEITAREGDKLQAGYTAMSGISRALVRLEGQPDLILTMTTGETVLAGETGLFSEQAGHASAFSDVLFLEKSTSGTTVTFVLAVSGSCGSARTNLRIKAILDLMLGTADIIYWKS